ncbi:TauD/TfdA dioxygenase family protein [Chamaesiphon polymorphus]|uniref:Taurine catabolism dioxygenase n=1 Tax=Chamaesiphon polymorphus CCALA 037 TaxID=2107692 RepID=A0A2T1GG44_9CYAN|nr:TauD/TfdA family dioxygenase [Chamaesiphon polymorphus]PSB56623.1 taurine catabolism dioxygenase [Chamaesiphon polymorphus CCALA 037]
MIEENISFCALSPFGAEVNELKITEINDRDLASLKHVIASNGLVVFRKQAVSDADFVAFLSRLGPMTFTAGETPVSHQPELNVVSNIGRERPPRSVFHTDTSYVARPPAFTALRALTIPASGGDTLFSDQYRAYETLPATVKEQLADARVLHVMSGLSLDDRQENQSWHPLFLRHPLSDRLALFLSTPERCQAISGMAVDKAQRLVRLLYQHSIRHYRLYRHRWQPGDIAIWDNRCTMHRADHSQVIGDRLLHRGMVLDEPIV